MIDQCCTFGDSDFEWCYHSKRELCTKSKKDTTCCECNEHIPAGVDHLISWLTTEEIDGNGQIRIRVLHTCSFCTAVLRDFFESNGSRIFNSLWYYMEGCHSISLSEATGAAR